MKKFLFTLLVFGFSAGFGFAENAYVHPIDRQEVVCKESATDFEGWSKCTYQASRAWDAEVNRYYSLLYKKLTGDVKTNLFENQKFWNMYRNYEIKLINGMTDKEKDSKDTVIYRANQKKDIVKNRAESLRMYYVQTFPDDDKEKIDVNSQYNPDNVIIRNLRNLGF